MVNLPILMIIEYGVHARHYSDRSISIREQRYSIFAIGLLFFVLLILVTSLGNGPRVLLACLLAALATTVISLLINRFTKVSLHSVAMAGCTVVFWSMNPIFGLLMALFSILVGWSRIRLGHHTLMQILIGWGISVLCVEVAFRLIL
jgi:membrane-associated phospholipid phosphatase